MSWSYDVTALDTSLKDQVRLCLGDTDEEDPVLQDEEIGFYIGEAEVLTPRILLNCINSCMAKVAGIPDYKLGPYEEKHSNRLDMWKNLKAELESDAYSMNAPLSKHPTTAPIFRYDIMSVHCCGEYKDEP